MKEDLFRKLDEEKLYDLAELFKVFGDSTRIRILFCLFETEAVNVGELAESLHMSVSAISHQLNILKHLRFSFLYLFSLFSYSALPPFYHYRAAWRRSFLLPLRAPK